MAFLNGLHPIFWGTYLLCMLLPLALTPLVAPCCWRRHWGKLSVFWAVAFTVFCGLHFPPLPYVVYFGGDGIPGRPHEVS